MCIANTRAMYLSAYPYASIDLADYLLFELPTSNLRTCLEVCTYVPMDYPTYLPTYLAAYDVRTRRSPAECVCLPRRTLLYPVPSTYVPTLCLCVCIRPCTPRNNARYSGTRPEKNSENTPGLPLHSYPRFGHPVPLLFCASPSSCENA